MMSSFDLFGLLLDNYFSYLTFPHVFPSSYICAAAAAG